MNSNKKILLYPQDTFYKRNRFFCNTAVAFIVSLLVYALSRFSVAIADFSSKYIGGAVRLILAGITSIFPFSVAEAFLLLLLPLVIILLFFVPDRDEGKYMTKNSYLLLGVLFLIMSIYFTAFAPCYFRTSIGDELSLDREAVSKEDVYNASLVVSEEMKKLEENIVFDHTGKTLMPYSYSTLVGKLNEAYDSLTEKYTFVSDFYSYPKPLAISGIMPYTRISGFYTFFSGEANVSTAYPDFMLPFTVAHEMAHQRGIAREDEANFLAFLVCLESNDDYIKYSGYAEMTNYLLGALYLSDTELYNEAYEIVPRLFKGEYSAYVDFVKSTDKQTVADVTNAVNNTMLQSQGQQAGSDSYGLVTELAAAYYKKQVNQKQ